MLPHIHFITVLSTIYTQNNMSAELGHDEEAVSCRTSKTLLNFLLQLITGFGSSTSMNILLILHIMNINPLMPSGAFIN